MLVLQTMRRGENNHWIYHSEKILYVHVTYIQFFPVLYIDVFKKDSLNGAHDHGPHPIVAPPSIACQAHFWCLEPLQLGIWNPMKSDCQKILKKIKNAHSLGPVRMQGPFPPQPTKHPRQLDSWTASNCGQLDRLDSPAFAARLADRLKSRHGELVTAGSAVSPFFFVDISTLSPFSSPYTGVIIWHQP